jgi:hypothetical protein
MKKSALTLLVVAVLALQAKATVVVHDPIHTLMNEGNWIITEIKQGMQYVKQCDQWVEEHTTALKETQQVENEIIQLERMGDPKAFGANLPGVRVITNLATIYQQGKQDAEDWAAFANPKSIKLTAEEVMGLYSNSLTGVTTSGGFKVPPAQGLIQFSLSDYNVANGAQDSVTRLIATKTALTQARDAAMAQVAAGGTDAEIQKLSVTINSLNGAIAGVDASIQQAVATANLQEQKNQAAEKVYKAGVVVQSASGFSGEVATSMDGLASVAPDDAKVPQWNP